MNIKTKKTSKIEPIIGNLGATIIGPRNECGEAQNPDLIVPPRTDKGLMPNLKWSFADSHMRIEQGGWAREVTVRELPSSPNFAGVNMRLKSGAIREMHWHHASEWSFMLKGHARITAVDQLGRTFQDDVSAGDLWYFPAGIPHSIQGLGDDGCEFLLVFDDGNFSEEETFLLTDWLSHIPKEVIAKNFSIAQSSLENIPKEELYIFQSTAPGKLTKDKVIGAGEIPSKFSHKMMDQKPIITKTGSVRITDSLIFKASQNIAAAFVEIEPGGMRELHWHPNSDEWQFYISGHARMTVFAGQSVSRTFDFQAGDVGSVPRQMPHYIENIGDSTVRFLEIFKTSQFEDVSLAQWLAFTPHELVKAHLNINLDFLKKVSKNKKPVVP